MVHVFKDIQYANIEGVDQCNCNLDLYLPDSVNNHDLYSKVEQFSDKNIVESESETRNGNVASNTPDQELLNYDQEPSGDGKVSHRDSTDEEKNGEDTRETGLPLVLFIHGGGWRRGARTAWKHYLYFDVNFVVAFLQFITGTYDNVGRNLAANNIPCAVISYPLTEASNRIILLIEMFLSYIQSVIFIFLLCVPIVGMVGLYRHMTYNVSFDSWNNAFIGDHDNNVVNVLKTILLLTMLLTNLVTAVLFLFKRSEYGFKSRQMICYSASGVVLASVLVTSNQSLSVIAIISLIINQSMIFNIRYKRSGSNYKPQVQAVAKAVRWAKGFSKVTGLTDERRVFLMGHSAGGHLTTLSVLDDSILSSVACTVNDLKGVISISGVYDLLSLNKTFLRHVYLYPTFGHNPVMWKEASPEHRVKNIENTDIFPKFLLVLAEKDFFLKEQSYQFSQTLDEMNLECKHVEIGGTNHFTITNDSRTLDGTLLFYVLDFVRSN